MSRADDKKLATYIVLGFVGYAVFKYVKTAYSGAAIWGDFVEKSKLEPNLLKNGALMI